MNIVAGRYYEDGAGCVIGPMLGEKLKPKEATSAYPFSSDNSDVRYTTSGVSSGYARKRDLVREVKPVEDVAPIPITDAVTHVGAEVMPASGPQTFEGPHVALEDEVMEEMPKAPKVKAKPTEQVDGPAHYGGKDNPYETIKVMRARLTPEEYIGALKFNIYKYNDRAGKKGSALIDHQKACFYQNELVRFIQEREAAEPGLI